MGLLSEMTVRYAVDISNLTSGISQAKSSMSSMSDATAQATAGLKQMSGAADLSRVISGVDVAQAQLTLLESKVTEARAKLQTLQDSANAGNAVTGIPEAEAQLTLLEAKAQEARTGLQELQTQEKATSETATTMGGGFGKGLSSITDFTSKIGMTVMGLQSMGQIAVQTASALLQPAATAETTELSFTTLLHSTKAAHDEMVALNTYAASTPMQTQWVDDASAKMLAFGFTQKDLIPDITAIGDSLSGLGKLTAPSLNSIVDIFGKIRAQGKLTGGDMMQLSTWGIPAWNALSESMHKPIPELQKMVSSGLIPADVAIKGLTGGMEKTFGGGMAKQANTFTGLMSTLASNFQIAMAALGTPVLKALEPQLAKLGTTLSSPAFQTFATTVGTQLGAALGNMVTGFMQLVAIGSQVVSFFQNNKIALDALVAILAGAAIGIMAFAVTQIPVLIAGLAAWAIAQWAVVVPLLATAAPFILIGIIAAAVIFGIILAVQHWGEISKWLQGVWAAFSAWFMGALGSIGAFFTGIWNGIATFFTGLWTSITGQARASGTALSSWWTGLWNGIVAGLKAAWAFIVSVVQIGAQLLLMAIIGPIIAIANLFIWLYNHNYYFKAMIDAIVNFVKAGIAWLQSAWAATVAFIVEQWNRLAGFASSVWHAVSSAISSAVSASVAWLQSAWNTATSWLSAQWQRLAGFATSIWNAIAGAIGTAVSVAVSFLQAQWNTATAWIQGQWNRLAGFARSAWAAVSAVFSSIWGTYIAGPLGSLYNQISGWFSSLGSMALQSGSNFINMLVSGITSGAGAIWNAVSGIASTIWKALGFHSPAKEGPASDSDRWMPNLVNMLSAGLIAGVPKMQSAAIAAAQPLRAFAPSSSGATAIVAANSSGSSSSGYAHTQNITLEVDGMQLAHIVNTNTDRHVRLKLGPRGRSA